MIYKGPSSEHIDISIIIPVFWDDDNIGRCLNSIKQQTLHNIEVIIIHNLSDDDMAIKTCKEYANKDSRICIVHSKQNTGAELCNEAISLAKGGYIGFALTSDWFEPDMYSALFTQAGKHNVDAVYSLVYIHKNDIKQANMEWVVGPHLFNAVLRDKWKNPNIYMKGPCLRGCILKKDFLLQKNIRFNPESQDPAVSMMGFSFLVFNLFQSCFIIRGAYCHHEISGELSGRASTEKGINILDEHAYIAKQIKERDLDSKARDLEAARAFFDIKNYFIKGCSTYGQKKFYLNYANPTLTEYLPFLSENNFLSKEDKRLFKKFVSHPHSTAFFDKHNSHIKILKLLIDIKLKNNISYLRVFKFPIIFIKSEVRYSTFNICKIPLRRVKVKHYLDNTKKTKYYYLGIPIIKKLETLEDIYTYFLGIRVGKKLNLRAQLKELNMRISEMPSQADIVYFSGMLNIVSAIHSKTFPQFKNSNTGKSIVILGTGPSFNYAPEITSSKILACNRSFMLIGDKEPDYIFAHDYVDAQDYFDELLKKSCPIFLGNFIYAEHNDLIVTPEIIRLRKNIYNYYTEYKYYKSIRTEIEYFPLSTISTIIDPALHFALYTNPDVIYIIGCDASYGGYADKNLVQYRYTPTTEELLNKIADGHRKFKLFRDTHYPNTKIVSVNPVGLRGIHDDVYTEEFLKHQDLDVKNPVIVKEI